MESPGFTTLAAVSVRTAVSVRVRAFDVGIVQRFQKTCAFPTGFRRLA